ncbi:hypothetical protein KFE25_004684 [Diacronema lutheri]|uniref:RanBP2-type domain-containing protein n=1 Tax=Diacronema lutheri TaxID=2081491 RepID=A0A8J5XA62_DIALT|nr:hypothetical protein KFE25_004684 [Diacronema lutheri]
MRAAALAEVGGLDDPVDLDAWEEEDVLPPFSSPPPRASADEWTCVRCTLLNPRARTTCAACFAIQVPPASSAARPSAMQPRIDQHLYAAPPRADDNGGTCGRASALASAVLADLAATRERARAREAATAAATAAATSSADAGARAFALPTPHAPSRSAPTDARPGRSQPPAPRGAAEPPPPVNLTHSYAGEQQRAAAAAAFFDRLEAEEAAADAGMDAEWEGWPRAPYAAAFGGSCNHGFGGSCNHGFGGSCNHGFGGSCNHGFGGSCNHGFGGSCNHGFGGSCNHGFGGSCNHGFGGSCNHGFGGSCNHGTRAARGFSASGGAMQRAAHADGSREWRKRGTSGPSATGAAAAAGAPGGAGGGGGGVPGSNAGRRAQPTPAMRQARALAAQAQHARRAASVATARAALPPRPPPPHRAALGARRTGAPGFAGAAGAGARAGDDEGTPAPASGRRMQRVEPLGTNAPSGARAGGPSAACGVDAARASLIAAREAEARATSMLVPSIASFHRAALSWPPHALESVALPLPRAPAHPSASAAMSSMPTTTTTTTTTSPAAFSSGAQHAAFFLPLLFLEARAQLSAAVAEALPSASRVSATVVSIRAVDEFHLVQFELVDPAQAGDGGGRAGAQENDEIGRGRGAAPSRAEARQRMRALLASFGDEAVFIVRPATTAAAGGVGPRRGAAVGADGSADGVSLCALAKVESREGPGMPARGTAASAAGAAGAPPARAPGAGARATDAARVTLRFSLVHAPAIRGAAEASAADASRRRGVLGALRPSSAWAMWPLSTLVTLNREFRALASVSKLRACQLLLRPQLQLRCAPPAPPAPPAPAPTGAPPDVVGRPAGPAPVARPAGLPAALWASLGLALNRSQLAAIAQAASHGAATLGAVARSSAPPDAADGCRLTLVQGPPGTGKTTVILALIATLLALRRRALATATDGGGESGAPRGGSRALPSSSAFARAAAAAAAGGGGDAAGRGGARALVCAPSNAAVDEIARRILLAGLVGDDGKPFAPRLVRLGAAGGTSRAVEAATLGAQMQRGGGGGGGDGGGGGGGGGVGGGVGGGGGLGCGRSSAGATGGCGGGGAKMETHKAAAEQRRRAALDELAAVRKLLDEASARAQADSDGASVAPGVAGAGASVAAGAASAVEGGNGGAGAGCAALVVSSLLARKRLAQSEVRAASEGLDRAMSAAAAESAERKLALVASADVVCCTLSGAGAETLVELALPRGAGGGAASGAAAAATGGEGSGDGGGGGCHNGGGVGGGGGGALRFPLVVIDEAAQAIELSALIPFKFGARHAVLVGDPKQLPATVLSTEAARCLYAEGLFHRAVRAGLKPAMLSVQYRMHPQIAAFPARHFYAGALNDGVSAAQRQRPHHASARGALGPFALHSVGEGRERGGGAGGSLRNDAEAAHVARLLGALREHAPELFAPPAGGGGSGAALGGYGAGGCGAPGGCRERERLSVACIAPYKEQVRALRRAATALLGEPFVAGASSSGALEFATVDGFQGREVDVLLYSATRASPSGGLGFVADMRRLNVALTRARTSLVLVGHAPTLARNAQFSALLEHARSTGALFDADDALRRCEREAAPVAPAGVLERARASGGAAVGGKRVVGEAGGDARADALPLSKRSARRRTARSEPV